MSDANDLTRDSAIKRAEAHGIDIGRLKAMLELTPTERLEMLRVLTQGGESAVARAEAYGIDISLLKLALTWTPTQRLEKLEDQVNALQAIRQARGKQYGT